MSWRIVSMSELYDFLNTEKSSVFVKPEFPTRRWGQIHTKVSTTDKDTLKRALEKYKKVNVKAKITSCVDSNNKYKKLGKFYKIEIYEQETNS